MKHKKNRVMTKARFLKMDLDLQTEYLYETTETIKDFLFEYTDERISLTKKERNILKRVIADLRKYQDDGETFCITNLILSKL